MRLLIFTPCIIVLFFSTSVYSKIKSKYDSTLSTNIHFNGLGVKGRFNTPGEVLVDVESEKKLNNLITMPNNFKVRIKESLNYD